MQGLDKRPGTPDPGPEPGPPSRPELPRQGGEYPSITMLDEMEAGNLQALFVLGGNVLSALPDARRVRAALERTPVVVVSDVQHGDMTERRDARARGGWACSSAPTCRTSRTASRPTLAAQYTPAVVPRRRRPEARLVAARRARASASAHRSCPSGLSLESTTDDDLLRLRIRPSARATFDELKAAPTALVDDDRSLGWVERNILPDGRWDLAPEPLLAQLEEVADVAPLVLIPRRLWRRVNSYGRDLPSVLEREPADILVHPADAAAAGVVDGGRVRVETRVRPPQRRRHGRRLDPPRRGGDPARLVGPERQRAPLGDENVDLLTGMPTYSGVPVTLSAA